MGQKTHPTGFRTGVNKTHASTWYANYGAYSQVLKEDYEIRKFFEKEFEPIYGKAGITKLEILRKVNQLELLVHAARPKAIAVDKDQNSIILKLKDNLSSAAKTFGLKMKVSGVPSMPYFRIEDQTKNFHVEWTDECLSRGLYLTSYHNHFLSVAHGEAEINEIVRIASEAFEAISI